ncbi:hypothetical protein [Natronoglycomyces albus]|uniref:Uncharacterized protein n=1 Tax=Natronoglycomyces albus TaxID=2811108 RepID=A0A895XTV8_9ACTN|nr:hypothetical protein [Natronoglycomyces albus]QSB05956.1 hypothetical protein JQS30_03245 [Natronoglycomyces albus]
MYDQNRSDGPRHEGEDPSGHERRVNRTRDASGAFPRHPDSPPEHAGYSSSGPGISQPEIHPDIPQQAGSESYRFDPRARRRRYAAEDAGGLPVGPHRLPDDEDDTMEYPPVEVAQTHPGAPATRHPRRADPEDASIPGAPLNPFSPRSHSRPAQQAAAGQDARDTADPSNGQAPGMSFGIPGAPGQSPHPRQPPGAHPGQPPMGPTQPPSARSTFAPVSPSEDTTPAPGVIAPGTTRPGQMPQPSQATPPPDTPAHAAPEMEGTAHPPMSASPGNPPVRNRSRSSNQISEPPSAPAQVSQPGSARDHDYPHDEPPQRAQTPHAIGETTPPAVRTINLSKFDLAPNQSLLIPALESIPGVEIAELGEDSEGLGQLRLEIDPTANEMNLRSAVEEVLTQQLTSPESVEPTTPAAPSAPGNRAAGPDAAPAGPELAPSQPNPPDSAPEPDQPPVEQEEQLEQGAAAPAPASRGGLQRERPPRRGEEHAGFTADSHSPMGEDQQGSQGRAGDADRQRPEYQGGRRRRSIAERAAEREAAHNRNATGEAADTGSAEAEEAQNRVVDNQAPPNSVAIRGRRERSRPEGPEPQVDPAAEKSATQAVAPVATPDAAEGAVDHPDGDVFKQIHTEPLPGRFVLKQLNASTSDLETQVTVTLSCDDTDTVGVAVSPAIDWHVHRATAAAALEAVRPYLGEDARYEIEHVNIESAGPVKVALVVVLTMAGNAIHRRAGAAVVTSERRQSIVAATLSALSVQI